jgi:acetyl-CoA acetyltransferase
MKKVFFSAGAKTLSMGRGRSEFSKEGSYPLIESLSDTVSKTIDQLGTLNLDEAYLANFMGARLNKQAHLAAFLPGLIPSLEGRPCTRVEAACASGGVALISAIKAILSGSAEMVLACGVEQQSHMKGLYLADVLAGAADYQKQRHSGEAFFFPGLFSDRAGAYANLVGEKTARRAMALWYEQAIMKARTCELAQEYQNKDLNLGESAMKSPNKELFLEHLNYYDCSKVSDGAASILVCSEEGLKMNGISQSETIELKGFKLGSRNIRKPPKDLARFSNMTAIAQTLLQDVGIKNDRLDVLELHDCFSISGLLSLEAMGYAKQGEAIGLLEGGFGVDNGPRFNSTGGLIGYGHPVGATGVRQLVDLWEQLKDVGDSLGLMLNMGGDDVTCAAILVQAAV